MDFMIIKNAVNRQLDKMSKGELFTTDVDKYELYDLYLSSFPEGSNPIYKERTEHDCNCCKQFIRNLGGVVAFVNGKIETIWDIEVEGPYQVVANALSAKVKEHNIDGVYRHYEGKVGTDHNHQDTENGIIKWSHFYYKLPNKFVMHKDSIPSYKGDVLANRDVLKRSLEEITSDSIEVVSELISQNALYRGQEHSHTISKLQKIKKAYDKLKTNHEKEFFLWEKSLELRGASRFRNTVIGTLLVDLSEGTDLEDAVKKFEVKVAPTNYKRTTALITQSMIKDAEKKVKELDLEDSLYRRYAVTEDITINNVLFADRSAKKVMGAFDSIAAEAKTTKPKLDKVQEVTVEEFINNILPKAESLEVMFENKHNNNLFSLIAPVHKNANPIFKWDNNFSWTYNGEVTDSIKEKVKAAGGSVTGEVRASLAWFNYDDLDLSVKEPDGHIIYFGNRGRLSSCGGTLDVDMNAGSGKTRTPVENITYDHKHKMKEGNYHVIVHNYSKRETSNVGFVLEFEVDGDIKTISYDKAVNNNQRITVITFNYSKSKGVTIVDSLPSTDLSKEVWGINTQTFHKVNMVMNSPNYWDEQGVGNKHLFFVLDKCYNPEKARGFYNEFLRQDLNTHRKVFEVLGSKMKTDESSDQLSGLGFSTTQSNELLCKVSGSFNRLIKIKF